MGLLRLEQAEMCGAEGFLAWQASIAPFFDVEVESPQEFSAASAFYHLGPIVCGPGRASQQHYIRSLRKVATTALDHYLVQRIRSGGSRLSAAGREVQVRPGDTCILDLSQTCESLDLPTEMFSLVVPQTLLEEALGSSADLHGAIIGSDSVTGGLLAEFLDALDARLPRADQADAPGLVEATLAVLSSALTSQTRPLACAKPVLGTLKALRIRRHIRRNLFSTSLSPQALGDHFHVSRSQLYRFFAGVGGVAGYVRLLRLRHCAACLADPSQRGRSVRDIAEEHGFGCGPHFARLFKRTFGVTASEVRRTGAREPEAFGSVGDWVRFLG
jgi:AraC-like DNA-binding protein